MANYDEAAPPAEASAEAGPRRRFAPREPWRRRSRRGKAASGASHVEKSGNTALYLNKVHSHPETESMTSIILSKAPREGRSATFCSLGMYSN